MFAWINQTCLPSTLLSMRKNILERRPINESWYIREIHGFIREASNNVPPELGEIIPKSFLSWNKGNKKSEIGILRLMHKFLKLMSISRDNLHELRCRGIKSLMNASIKVVQKCLDRGFNHLLYFVEEEFVRRFCLHSPSVTGIDEAITRVRNSKTGDWGSSFKFKGDLEDLYSNCHSGWLKECIRTASSLADLDVVSINFILILMRCVMNHSYFHEPEGIFQTLNDFSMGDCSAAQGSEVILRVYKLKIFEKLSQEKLIRTVTKYLWFLCAYHWGSLFHYTSYEHYC